MITEHEAELSIALQRIDVLEDENEAQRQYIRILREELLGAANSLSDAANILEDKNIAKILHNRSAKYRNIATDGRD